MNFIPKNNRILIKPDKAEDISAGGIIIPDNAKERPLSGTVVTDVCEPNFSLNDKVLYSKYAGTEIILNEETYLIMNQDEIYGKFID